MRSSSFALASVLALAACNSFSEPPVDEGPGAPSSGGAPSRGGGQSAGGSASNGGATSSGGTTGGGGSGGQPSNGGGGQSTAGSGGVPESDGGEGGEGGAASDQPCVIESLHVKVSGGIAFERNGQSADSCIVLLGGEDQQVNVSFVIDPPETETRPLLSVIAHGVVPGSEGTFPPVALSVLSLSAIWSKDLPEPDSLACSLILTTYDQVAPQQWRLAGSVTCPSAVSGIGEIGSTPLVIEDWSFAVLVETEE